MGLATAAIVVGGAMAVAGTVKAIQGGSEKKKAKAKAAVSKRRSQRKRHTKRKGRY